jgi:hypothetical protein
MKHKPINVLMFMRLAITLILILLFIEGLLGARSYSNSTYGCGYDDFIAADPKTALIYLLLSLPLAFFIFVNITSILKGEKNVPKKMVHKIMVTDTYCSNNNYCVDICCNRLSAISDRLLFLISSVTLKRSEEHLLGLPRRV